MHTCYSTTSGDLGLGLEGMVLFVRAVQFGGVLT